LVVAAGSSGYRRADGAAVWSRTGVHTQFLASLFDVAAEGTGRALSELKFLRAVSAERPHGR
jgi:hypothetical protein